MFVLAMLFQAAASQPLPVYFKCAINDGQSVPMDVQLNEAAGTASYSFTIGGRFLSFTKPAAFTADRVSFNGFTISRIDLSFARENPAAGLTGMDAVSHGSCQKVTVNRAF